MLITVNHRNPLRCDKTWTFHVLEGQHPSRRAAEAWRGHHDVQRHHQAQNQVGNGNPVLILHKYMNQSSFVPFIYLIHVAFERLSWKTPIETELERTDKGFSEDCATWMQCTPSLICIHSLSVHAEVSRRAKHSVYDVMGLNDLTCSLSKSRPVHPGVHPFPMLISSLYWHSSLLVKWTSTHIPKFTLGVCVLVCEVKPSCSVSCASSNVCVCVCAWQLIWLLSMWTLALKEKELLKWTQQDLVFATLEAVPAPVGDDESPFMGTYETWLARRGTDRKRLGSQCGSPGKL